MDYQGSLRREGSGTLKEEERTNVFFSSTFLSLSHIKLFFFFKPGTDDNTTNNSVYKLHTKDYIGEGNGTPLQYSCLENPMDGGAWQAAVHDVAKSLTQLSDFTLTFHFHALEKEMATHSSYSCLENPRDGGAWWAAVYGVAHSWTRLK